MLPLLALAQTKQKDSIVDKPERPAFDSATLIDNPTNVLFIKNTLEVQMQHRFGSLFEDNSLFGIYGANTNIRIGFSYTILDGVAIGYGFSKINRLHDFNWKVSLLKQTRSDRTPLSIAYYGNFAIDGRSSESNDNVFYLRQHRYSNFHQLIFARRFSPKLSLQVAPSLSHYNTRRDFTENNRFAIAIGGRYKISAQTSILLDYSQPITMFDRDPDALKQDGFNPLNQPGISLGTEFATSGHIFQIFITNYNGIVPQQNYMKNTNDFFHRGALIGFNITRNYNF